MRAGSVRQLVDAPGPIGQPVGNPERRSHVEGLHRQEGVKHLKHLGRRLRLLTGITRHGC
jgi:hypothetical protein